MQAGERRFIQVAVDLYRNDPHWIRPLDRDINEVFDPAKTKPSVPAPCNDGYYRTMMKTNRKGSPHLPTKIQE